MVTSKHDRRVILMISFYFFRRKKRYMCGSFSECPRIIEGVQPIIDFSSSGDKWLNSLCVRKLALSSSVEERFLKQRIGSGIESRHPRFFFNLLKRLSLVSFYGNRLW